jgi:hypothetical protein
VRAHRPKGWFIVFGRAPTRRTRLLAFGRYSHVACFCHADGRWLVFDPYRWGFNFAVARDGEEFDLIGTLIDGALVLYVEAPPMGTPRRRTPCMTCVSLVSFLTGVPSRALRPDRFLKDCLAYGATLEASEHDEIVDPTAGPRTRPRASGSDGRENPRHP